VSQTTHSGTIEAILSKLEVVAHERARRLADPALGSLVTGLKEFQHRRFSRTYEDLLQSTRYGAAARFFLEELYGPSDFTGRDAQFARVVPALVRLFPQEVVKTVIALSELHSLTESLDTAMANNASMGEWTPARYLQAWQKTGRRSDRETQVALTVALATRLDTLTRSTLLRTSLRLMRAPARATGLADLQRVLESGFDAFVAIGGAGDFIRMIETRERSFVSSLFSADVRELESRSGARSVLGDLPGNRR
jgi:hypothetical protein